MTSSTQHLNRVSARNNPFAVQRTDAVLFDFGETPFDDIGSFYQHAKRHNFRGAIQGRHGRGKTTLLCNLHSHLRDQNIDCELVFLPREKPLQQRSIDNTSRRGSAGAIILIDGLERISFLSRQRFLHESRSFAGFIATTHFPSRLRKLIHCRTSQQSLIAVLNSLNLNRPHIVAAALPLLSSHQGNMRSVLRTLYDLHADGKLDGSQ